jgi:hypothetical protein
VLELACGSPSRPEQLKPLAVMKAKFSYSAPPTACAWHVGFIWVPLMGSCDRLSMTTAEHQRVGSQLEPDGHRTQPGG